MTLHQSGTPDAEGVVRHVEQSMRCITDNPDMKRLLALTFSHAEPGIPSLEIVFSLLSEPRPLKWSLFHKYSGDWRKILTVLDLAVRHVRDDAPEAGTFEVLCGAHAGALGMSPEAIHSIVAIALVGQDLRLPVDAIVGICGGAFVSARIDLVREQIRLANLVG
jgi:hypothetical protein